MTDHVGPGIEARVGEAGVDHRGAYATAPQLGVQGLGKQHDVALAGAIARKSGAGLKRRGGANVANAAIALALEVRRKKAAQLGQCHHVELQHVAQYPRVGLSHRLVVAVTGVVDQDADRQVFALAVAVQSFGGSRRGQVQRQVAHSNAVLLLQTTRQRGQAVCAARHQQQVMAALGHQVRQLQPNAIAGTGDQRKPGGFGGAAHCTRSQVWVR